MNAPTDAVLRLEHDGLVALPLQLPGRNQAGHSCAEDEDPSRRACPSPEPPLRNREDIGSDRLVGERVRLAARQQLVLALVELLAYVIAVHRDMLA